ncbi:MAG TPA: hypothetical protein VGO99_04635, partial [Leifsonia sp.]|nr:hypothetical protein [Leifsonia sp.]
TSDYEPVLARPDERGHLGLTTRVRARLSEFFFEDRLAPITQSELDHARAGAGADADGGEKPAHEVSIR